MLEDMDKTLEGSKPAPGWGNPGLTNTEMWATVQIPMTGIHQEKAQDRQV